MAQVPQVREREESPDDRQPRAKRKPVSLGHGRWPWPSFNSLATGFTRVKDSIFHPSSKVILHVADVGQGTAVLIQLTEGGKKYFLYDGGNPDIRCYNLFKTVGKVCSKTPEGNYELNGIVVSHPDLDHLGGVVRLLTNKPPFKPPITPPIKVTPCPTLLTTACLRLPLTTEASEKSKAAARNLFDYLCRHNIRPAVIYSNPKCIYEGILHQSFYCIFPHEEMPGLLYINEPPQDISPQVQNLGPIENLRSTEIMNESSVLLQVNRKEKTIDVSLHGDAHGYQIAPHVKDKKVLAFLVPHHGSRECSMLLDSNNSLSSAPVINCAKLLACYKILNKPGSLGIFNTRKQVLKGRKCKKARKGGKEMPKHENKPTLQVFKIKKELEAKMFPREKKRVPGAKRETLSALKKKELEAKKAKMITKRVREWGKSLESQLEAQLKQQSNFSPISFLKDEIQKELELLTIYNESKPGPLSPFGDIINKVEQGCIKQLQSWCYTVECQKFYRCCQANTYIITSGRGAYRHPDMEVLNGIALAAVQRNETCQIVLTNSAGLEPWKLSDVFFGNNCKVSVWYLDDDEQKVPANERLPCVTIDPLQDLYVDMFQKDQNNPMLKGMKRLALEKSPEEWSKNLEFLYSPKLFQILEVANPNAPQPEPSDPYLPEYMKNIGHKGDITLSTLLEYILGFKIAHQISTSYPHGLLGDLGWYTWKVKEESSFFLSATGLAVQSCEIHLDVPKLLPQVQEKKVETTTLRIKNIRTMELQLEAAIGFESESQPHTSSLTPLNSDLDYNGTCGQPPAEYLAAIGVDIKSCVSMASDLTVGEVLALLLSSTRATVLVRSFPDFISTSLIKYRIDPLQTTIDFQQSNGNIHIVEAHIVAKIPEDETSCMTLANNGLSVHLQVHKAFLHLFPSYDKTEQLLGLSGEVTENHKYRMTMKATPNFYDTPEMEFTLADSFTISEVLSGLDFPAEFQVPFTEQKLQANDKISAGFTIQQPFLQAPRMSSIFFDVEWFANLPPFWPESMKVIKEASLRLSLVFPLESDVMVGIKARFICELNLQSKKKNIILECSFSATPNTSKENQYSCFFSLRPSQRPYEELEDVQGAPILDMITAVNETVGEGLRTVFSYTWPELVDAIELRELSLQLLSSGSVEGFRLDVGIYDELELITGKLALSNARLLIDYSPGYVQLECEGYLTFFQQYETFVSFLLPTPDSPGELRFENADTDFTLERFVSGMFGLGDSISKVPILSDLLSVSINSVHINFERQGSNTVITHAKVTLTKEELSLGSIKISSIEITVAVDRINSEYTFDFSLSGFIGDVLYARLQYYDSEPTSMLRGDIILASFREIDATSALKELNIDHLPSPSPLLGDSPGATAHLAVAIQITKQPVSFDLAHLVLNLTNVVQFENFAITQLWFEYAKSTDRFKFFGSLCKLDTQESAALEFIWDKTAITATVVSGLSPESPGGLLKLSSLLDLVDCGKPDIPQLDSSATFFDLELKSGSISFKPKPIKVSAFEVSVVSHGELCLINDPRIVVSDVVLHADWKEGAKVNGIVSATFHFSSTLVPVICKKDASDVLLTAQIEPKEMNTGTEIQHIGQNDKFSDLIPSKVFHSQAIPLAVAINVTRKQFLFLSKITNFGNGVLFVGKSGLALSISLQDGFKFKDVFHQLSFIDELIKVRSANLAVSSLHGVKVSEFRESISKLTEGFRCDEVPFSNLPVSSPDLNQQTLSSGVSIFAAMDINQAEDSVLKNIIQIQENQTSLPDLMIKASVVKRSSASGGYNVSIEAHLRELTLLGKLQFWNIGFLYHLSEQESLLKLSGTLHLDFGQSPCDFYGSLTITKSDARFELEKVKSESPFASPLGMDLTLTGLGIKAQFDLKKRTAPLIELVGSINIGHLVDLTAMIILRGFLPKVVVIDITTELSVASLLASLGKSKPGSLMDFKILKGHFHYATSDTCVEKWMVPKQIHTYRPSVTRNRDGSVVYSGGIHVRCDIKILFFKFDIRLDISQDFSSIEISGRSVEKVNLWWIKLTDPEFEEGPVISYSMSKTDPGKLKISVGLEILGKPWFVGALWYEIGKPYLKASVEYKGTFLWMQNPRIELMFMVKPPFVMITDFSFGKGDKSGSIFNLGERLKKFCKWLFDLVKKVISQDFDLNLRTAENPDPERFSVVFTISGTYKVKFFNSDRATVSLDLPTLPVEVPKGFSLGQLPKLIVKALWGAGKWIVTKIVDYIKSRGILGILQDLAHAAVVVVKKVATIVYEGVKKVASAVVSGVKSVAKKISGWFSWAFGSIHIYDQTGKLIAEILGGREGKPLYNEQHVVPLFAPLTGILGIHHHGEHLHTSGRASLNLPSHWRDAQETEEGREERKATLEALKRQHDELGPQLVHLAVIMLEIQHINLRYDHPNRILVKWEMDPSIMEVDKGDFDYNVKVVASTLESCEQETSGLSLRHHTIFDDRLNHSVVVSVPFTLIVDEQEILPHAYRVTVSIQASITMSVKAHDITDDVTTEGEWKHTEIYLDHPSLQPPSSISMHYDDSLHSIAGSLDIVSSVQAYIVQLVDADNPSNVIDQVIVPQPQSLPPDGCLDYTLNLSELPKNALKGSHTYTVRVQSVGNSNSFSEFILCETRCTCEASPTNVRLLPSDTNGDCVEVCWNTHTESSHLSGFSLQLYAGLSGSELQEIIRLPQIAADDSTTHSCSFRLSEIAEALQSKSIIPSPDSDLVLQCYVYAHGNENTLPSIPACSQECYLLPPPASVQCFYSPIKKSLYVGWKYVSHALSYRIELVNMATDEVTLEHVHYQSTFSWKEHDCESVFTDDDLKRAPLQGSVTYKVQVFTLGHGEDYLGSLESCASTTLLQTPPEQQMKLGTLFIVLGQEEGTPLQLITSLKMSNTPGRMDESICLSWEPPQFGADSYTVSVNDFEKVTSSTEVHLSPMALGILSAGEHTVSVIPDGDTQTECTFTFSVSELFTEFCVTAQTATSLSVQYELTLGAPEDMNYYLIAENACKPNISHSIPLHPESETNVITLHHIQPETKYNLYAVAFSEDCTKWAIPRKIETASLSAPKQMYLLGRNLLDDSSGADMTMGFSNCKQTATAPSSVEDSWAIEPWTPESKCDPPPLDLPTMYCTAKDASVMRTQLIDLGRHGFSPAFLDEYQPDIRIQSWVCAPDVSDSPTNYTMVVKLLSEDQEELARFQKGPLRLHPNGEWRAAELSVSNYGSHLRYIEFTDSGSSENDNTTRVAGTTVRLGYPPGSCIEVYSLPHRNSLSSGSRTCLVQLSSPNMHTLFQSWRIEYSEADPESGKTLPVQLQDFHAPIGTQKVHHISLKVPIQAVRMNIFALGNEGTQQKVGETFLPPMKNPHVFERNLLTADILEPQMPLHEVAPDAVIPSRAWADLSQEMETSWSSEHWTEEKTLGFDPPPCCSNFVLMKHTKSEDVQRMAKIDLWALGFSPSYLATHHSEFQAVIQYAVHMDQPMFKQELQITSATKQGSENLITNATITRSGSGYNGEWRKLSLHAALQPKSIERYLIIYDKGYGCLTACTEVKPLLNSSTAPMIYVANLQSRAVKLQFLDTESIMHTITQTSPTLLVEYRILQDSGNHGTWSEYYFGLPSELSSGILVSNLSPSTMYEFAVTLTDRQRQEEYFSATTSGCTLPERQFPLQAHWGPYLSERQWATVREDYSPHGSSWDYFPHDHARSRVYRWGEDGLLGICDQQCRLCFSLALWNEKDPILKERIFGLTDKEGNHGEDPKECYYYLDSTPTHSYMKALYKYPHAEYPYATLVEENQHRSVLDPEFKLEDTGVFDEANYWDVFMEYAKAAPSDMLIRITVCNRGSKTACLHLLPTLWYRNMWIWNDNQEGCTTKPLLKQVAENIVQGKHATLGKSILYVGQDPEGEQPPLLWTENETNCERLWGSKSNSRYVKDAFHRYIVNEEKDVINPDMTGTKVAAHYTLKVPPGEKREVKLRLVAGGESRIEGNPFGLQFDETFQARKEEADEFYERIIPQQLGPQERSVTRQAYAGLLWTKQFYHYNVQSWLEGDPKQPPPPEERWHGRNTQWMHLVTSNIISVPDKWEHPCFASWDLAFHTIPFAKVDLGFAKEQLSLLLSDRLMAPSGQIPDREFGLSSLSPPLHAWAVWQVYTTTAVKGERDLDFLTQCFQRLMLNFDWWVSRKDAFGRDVLSGGFLSLNSIGIIDSSKPLPAGVALEMTDGAAWLAFFSIMMLRMSIELSQHDPAHQPETDTKLFNYFLQIVDTMSELGMGLWNEEDGFYYDQIGLPSESHVLRVRSIMGLVPLFSSVIIEKPQTAGCLEEKLSQSWFLRNKKDLLKQISCIETQKEGKTLFLLALPSKDRLLRVLQYMLDENEFLSSYGIRSVSKVHQEHPVMVDVGGESYSVGYVPGENDLHGNVNWHGPVWFCVNHLIIECLERYHSFYGDGLKVECPTGSGKMLTLLEVSQELCQRLTSIFLPDQSGQRPCHGDNPRYTSDPHWKDLVLFYQYFNGDTGKGCGASHQTGWTSLVTHCFDKIAEAVPAPNSK